MSLTLITVPPPMTAHELVLAGTRGIELEASLLVLISDAPIALYTRIRGIIPPRAMDPVNTPLSTLEDDIRRTLNAMHAYLVRSTLIASTVSSNVLSSTCTCVCTC